MENKRLAYLLNTLSSMPEDAFILYALAKEYEKAQDDNEALVYYNRLKDLHPDYVGLYYHLGKLHERQDNFNLALEVYDAGIAVAKRLNDQHAWSELAGARLNIADED